MQVPLKSLMYKGTCMKALETPQIHYAGKARKIEQSAAGIAIYYEWNEIET